MKSKINQYAKNNNLEIAAIYLDMVPAVFFISLLVVVAFVYSTIYSLAAISIIGIIYLFINFSIAAKNSFAALFELALTEPVKQN